MLKSMKRRLQDTADHFHKLANQAADAEDKEEDEEEDDNGNPRSRDSAEELERKRQNYTQLAV